MKIIDAKGMLCPKPLILTKKALSEIKEDEGLQIAVDNENSLKNVSRYLKDNGYEIHTDRSGTVTVIHVLKKGQVFSEENSENYSITESKKTGNYIIAVFKNTLGNGPEDLGEILIKAFINTIAETEIQPASILFMNSGIHFTVTDSPVLDSLKKLEEKGVEILVCGTCLDYFKNMNELRVGKVSNMYEIMDKLSKTDKIIYP